LYQEKEFLGLAPKSRLLITPLQKIEVKLYELKRKRRTISTEIQHLEEEYRRLGGILEVRY